MSPALQQQIVRWCCGAGSLLAVFQLQDFLDLDEGLWAADPRADRINVPGTVNETNWTWRMPLSLAELRTRAPLDRADPLHRGGPAGQADTGGGLMPKLFFPIARAARKRYTFGGEIFSSIGNVVFLDLHAARLFTQGINAARKAAADPRESLRAGDMNAMGLIDEILHYVVELYSERANPHAMPKALSFVQRSLGKPAVDAVLARYIQEFPPPGAEDPAVFLAGDEEGIPRREIVLQEILLLSLSNANPAFSPFLELFDHAPLAAETPYTALLAALGEFFRGQPVFGPDSQDLVEMLRSPGPGRAPVPGRPAGVHPHPLGGAAGRPAVAAAYRHRPDQGRREAALRHLHPRAARGLRVREPGGGNRGIQLRHRVDAAHGDARQERPGVAGPAQPRAWQGNQAPRPGARRRA